MNTKSILAALVLGLATAGAQASVLTFDNLTDFMYGDGFPLASGMSYDGSDLVYIDNGVKLTLHAPGSVPGEAHIGDGTFASQTYNWHDGMENGDGSWLSLTRVDGAKFNLISFDYFMDVSTVLADGVAVGDISDGGTWNTPFAGISELRVTAGAYNQIDNVDVEASANASAVPLPGTLALLLGGAVAGRLARRRKA
jgi:hypothetical protein